MSDTRKGNQATTEPAPMAAGIRLVERLSTAMPKSLNGSWLVLTAVLLPVSGVVSLFGYLKSGGCGVAAAASAAVICWLAGMSALFVTAATRGTLSALSGLMGSMLLRTGIPLAAAVILSNSFVELAEAGVFGFFVILYLVTLAAETLLSVGLLNASKRPEEAS